MNEHATMPRERARLAVLLSGLLAGAALLPGVAAAVPVVYTETIAPATFFADSKVGLGNVVFDHGNLTVLTFTFSGDTADVRPYRINNTYGYIIDKGVATVEITDAVIGGLHVTATFDPGEIYVGTDIPGGGIGFGSRIYPIYPYALLRQNAADFSQPAFDLRHDLSYRAFGISCVGYASGPCKNVAPFGADFPLHTDQGDFWVTAQGITSGFFSVTTSVPEPSTAGLLLAGLAALAFRRARTRNA